MRTWSFTFARRTAIRETARAHVEFHVRTRETPRVHVDTVDVRTFAREVLVSRSHVNGIHVRTCSFKNSRVDRYGPPLKRVLLRQKNLAHPVSK